MDWRVLNWAKGLLINFLGSWNCESSDSQQKAPSIEGAFRFS